MRHVNLTVDSAVWERVQDLFPNQASKMVREYLEELVSTRQREGQSRDEILSKLEQVQKEKEQAEREEHLYKQQLNIYDKEAQQKKQVLESEDARNKVERFKLLPNDVKFTFADLVQELNKVDTLEYGTENIASQMYFSIDEEAIADILNVCDKRSLFELKSKTLEFRRQWQRYNEAKQFAEQCGEVIQK